MQETELFAILIASIALLAGTITDIKKREVPDWINYSLFFTAIIYQILRSILEQSFIPVISGAQGFIIALALGSLMFYTKQWGGGDAKMLIALGTLFGFSYKTPLTSITTELIINIFLVGALYGMLWSITISLINFKRFKAAAKENYVATRITRRILLGCALACALAGTIWFDFYLFFASMGVLLILFAFLIIFAKSVEQGCMLKSVPTKELTLGDWVAEDIKKGKKILIKKSNPGLEQADIELIKKNNIKKVPIKIGIPFIPSFLLGFLVTLWKGNLILLLIYAIL